MKNACSLAAACLCFFVGCSDDKTAKADKPSSGNPLTAPADYVEAAGKAQNSARKNLGALGLDQAIKSFHTEKGRLPKDLNELVSEGTLQAIPPAPRGMKYDYDATTGVVKVVPE
jgi:hypothetical protein